MFCDRQQTLGHVIGGCRTVLLKSTENWRHGSILLNTYKTIKLQGLQAFVDAEVYPNPTVITGNQQRPDFAIVKGDHLLILELTSGFKTNIKKSFDQKVKRYQHFFAHLSNKCKVCYVNLSLGDIGTVAKDILIMTPMKILDLSKETLSFIANTAINVCIRNIYYILCMRNEEWENPGKMAQILNFWS